MKIYLGDDIMLDMSEKNGAKDPKKALVMIGVGVAVLGFAGALGFRLWQKKKEKDQAEEKQDQ